MITSLGVETRLFIGTCIILVLVMLWRIAILWKRRQRLHEGGVNEGTPPKQQPEHWLDTDWQGDEHKSEND